MSVPRTDTDRRISALVQHASDLLCLDTPDKLHLSFVDDKVWYRCAAWSATVTRHHQEGHFGVFDADLGGGYDTPSLLRDGLAFEMVKRLFGSRIQTQINRNTVARNLGLVGPGGFESLPPEHLLIDRLLLAMLDRSEWDIRAAAASAASTKQNWFTGRAGMVFMRTDFGDMCVVQKGLNLPVIHIWHPLGPAKYNGNLFIPELLPETVAAKMAGRRVGELVSTGIPALDSRRIKSIYVADEEIPGLDPWPAETDTWVTIEPDLVELGRGHSDRAGGPDGCRQYPGFAPNGFSRNAD